MYLLAGNWTPTPGEKGISVYEYNSQDGTLTSLNHNCPSVAASFLTESPNPGIIYATNETASLRDGIPEDQIVAFDISDIKKGIRIISENCSLGPNPTWICATYNSSHLLISHHGGFSSTSTIERDSSGNLHEKIVYDMPHVVLYRINKNGVPDRPVDAYLPKEASGDTIPGRFSRSHSVLKAPLKNLYLICDKGLDAVMSVTIDFANEKIIPLDSVNVPTSYAPRHGVFHSGLPVFYADMEGHPSVSAISYDERGNLEIIQTLDLTGALRKNLQECRPQLSDQELQEALDSVMPSGIILNRSCTRLYIGLRGVNLIGVIKLEESGRMELIQLCPDNDGTPNFLTLSPDENYLFVANIFEGVITKFKTEGDGRLEYLGIAAYDRCPASLLFVDPSAI